MKQIASIFVGAISGFLGGALSTRMIEPQISGSPATVIRANKFELLDENGRTISYWGIDKGQNVVLAFGNRLPKSSAVTSGDVLSNPLPLDVPENQQAAVGIVDNSPFLYLRGRDRKTHVRLYLNLYGKPMLLMDDDTGPKISLGIEQSDTPGPQDNDWTLAFGPDNRVRIGTYTEREGGQWYVRGTLSVRAEKMKYIPDQPK